MTKKALPMKKIRVVKVYWVDSQMSSGWRELDDPSDLLCVSVGVFISKTKDRVTLATSINSYDLHADIMEIPLCCIKRIQFLKGK